MKDLFSGSLGRLNNHGGAKMYTTPHTIGVQPEYEVETDIPSVAEFVTCTLDGRIWIYRRSRRYYVAVFRWDEETQKLVFVSTTVLNGETVIKRGVDWILTDKSFIQPSDNEPYISQTKYDSDDTSYIDAINESCSFFPEFETWDKIQGTQTIHIADAPSLDLRSLNIIEVPSQAFWETSQGNVGSLEFHYYDDNNIQAYINFKFQLCYCNGQIFCKGKAHIGRAYLLPRRFNSEGEPVGFYLYISPSYLRDCDIENQTFDDNDGWNDFIVAPFEQDTACIFTPENEDYGLCKIAENAQVISLPQNEKFDYSADNGAIFFDGFTLSNLVLNDKGANFLQDNLNYECKGLNQWLAPSGKVYTVSSQFMMSQFDNVFLSTNIRKFHRELLSSSNNSVFSIKQYSGKNLCISDTIQNNKKFFNVNTIKNTLYEKTGIWNKIYRPFITVEFLYEPISFGTTSGWDTSFNTSTIVPIIRHDNSEDVGVPSNTYLIKDGMDYTSAWVIYGRDPSGVVIPSFQYYGTNSDPGTYSSSYTISFEGYNTEINECEDVATFKGHKSCTVSQKYIHYPGILPYPYEIVSYSVNVCGEPYISEPNMSIRDGKVGDVELPEYVKKYTTYNNVKKNPMRCPLSIETEIANLNFFDKELILGDRDSIIQDWLGNNYYLHTIHFFIIENKRYAYSLTFHQDVFDFNQEWQRSKLL